MMQPLPHLEKLIAFPSVSRVSNVEITDYLHQLLAKWGFSCERTDFLDPLGVPKSNLVAKRGTGTKGLAYFCHTDVVPADTWSFPESGAFQCLKKGDKIYGRGSCDMKGSASAFLAAIESTLDQPLKHPIYFIATADEEVGYRGARVMVEKSGLYQDMVTNGSFGIVGEPTSLNVVYAHKGVCTFKVVSHGKAAHSSTSDGLNANLKMIPFLQEMKAIHDESEALPEWKNAEFNPPTISWNIGINDYTYAKNIKAGKSICTVMFRPLPGQDPLILLNRVREKAEELGLEFVQESLAYPMSRAPDSPMVVESLQITGQATPQTVSYGTDGAVYTGIENLIVCGPGSIQQAHTDDEWIDATQLQRGAEIYHQMITKWCL
jgi:acetylornithine deacetylase